jgi:hypothetical protein
MRAAVVMALGLLAGSAQAQAWVSVDETDEGTMYVDVGSIRPQGPYMKAWQRFRFNQPKTSTGFPKVTYQSTKVLAYYNCKDETSADKQGLFYADADGIGKIAYSYSLTDQQLNFEDPVPGSAGQTLLRRICQYKK